MMNSPRTTGGLGINTNFGPKDLSMPTKLEQAVETTLDADGGVIWRTAFQTDIISRLTEAAYGWLRFPLVLPKEWEDLDELKFRVSRIGNPMEVVGRIVPTILTKTFLPFRDAVGLQVSSPACSTGHAWISCSPMTCTPWQFIMVAWRVG